MGSGPVPYPFEKNKVPRKLKCAIRSSVPNCFGIDLGSLTRHP